MLPTHHVNNGQRLESPGFRLPQSSQTVCRLTALTDDDHQSSGVQRQIAVAEFGGQLPVTDVVDAAGVFQDCRHVRGHIGLTAGNADDHGGIFPGRIDLPRIILEHHFQAIAAPHPHHRLGDGVDGAHPVLFVVIVHQLDKDFCVGLAVKGIVLPGHNRCVPVRVLYCCEAEARPADETAEAKQGQRSDFCKPAAAGAANRETAGAARPVKPANRYQPARIRTPSLVRIRFFFVRSALQGVLKHNRTAKERGTACPTAAPRFSFIFSSGLTVFPPRAGGRPER